MTEVKVGAKAAAGGMTREDMLALIADRWEDAPADYPNWKRWIGEGDDAPYQTLFYVSPGNWYVTTDSPDDPPITRMEHITEANEPIRFRLLRGALEQAERWRGDTEAQVPVGAATDQNDRF